MKKILLTILAAVLLAAGLTAAPAVLTAAPGQEGPAVLQAQSAEAVSIKCAYKRHPGGVHYDRICRYKPTWFENNVLAIPDIQRNFTHKTCYATSAGSYTYSPSPFNLNCPWWPGWTQVRQFSFPAVW